MGSQLVTDSTIIKQASDIGIIFLLFLLGLDLHPQKLFHMMRKATATTIIGSLIFAMVAFGIGLFFGHSPIDSFVIACGHDVL